MCADGHTYERAAIEDWLQVTHPGNWHACLILIVGFAVAQHEPEDE